MATKRSSKRDPFNDPNYEGLVSSYLIDPRPRVFWVVHVKASARRGWSSCTQHSNRNSALRDLGRTREHFDRWCPWNKAYLITAHLNF